MGDIAAFSAGGWLRCKFRVCGTRRAAVLLTLAAVVLAACAPDYDWRDIRGTEGEYWVHLPGKPATMTRQIHLEGLPVQMTMQGAKVKENAFTVALVPLPAQPIQPIQPNPPFEGGERVAMSPEHILRAMREQMLRNIGASPSTPPQGATVDLVDIDGRKVGTIQMRAVSARGTGKHADIELRARFAFWRGQAVQIVAVGPGIDAEQASHFLDSLRLVQR